MRGSLLIFPLLVICFEHIRAGSDCEPCRDVVEGPNRGWYYLKRTNEPRCWNGCAYEREGYPNRSWCLNEPGEYLTETCPDKGPGQGWQYVNGTANLAVYEKNDGSVNSTLLWCGHRYYGGTGGKPFSDLGFYANPNGGRVSRIEFGTANYKGNFYIKAMQTTYGNDVQNTVTPWRGALPPSSNPTILDFGDEPITSIKMIYKDTSVQNPKILNYVYGLQFTKENGKSFPLVGSDPSYGTKTKICGPFPNCNFAFFTGAAGQALDKLGLIWICDTDVATTIQNNFD